MTGDPLPGDRLRELARKAIHNGVGLLVFVIVFLGPARSALLALALLAFNFYVLPRFGGRLLWRPDDVGRGVATGIVAYPVAVLALILVFWHHIEIAAATWGILAFGDGMAGILGTLAGRARLPWNPRKSWAGSLAYWLFGAAGAAALLYWTLDRQGRELPPAFLVTVAVLTALFAAAIESQPQGLDDNLSVPLPAALVLLGLLQSRGWWSEVEIDDLSLAAAIGAGVNLALSWAAWRLRAVDRSGAVAGWILGTAIWTFLDWTGAASCSSALFWSSARVPPASASSARREPTSPRRVAARAAPATPSSRPSLPPPPRIPRSTSLPSPGLSPPPPATP